MPLKHNCLTAILLLHAPLITWSQVSVLTQHNDIARTGANLAETILTPSTVNVNVFGKLFTRTVDGQLFAQPLYVNQVTINGTTRNVVYLATENNTVYAFDADDPLASSPLWSTHLGTPGNANALTSGDNVTPYVGITSTPVIDQQHGWLYVVAKTIEPNNTYAQRLHALDIKTGAEVASIGSPVLIAATVPGSGDGGTTVTFNPKTQLNRPALLLTGGFVYIAFGSHADILPYHGWVFRYSASNLASPPVAYTVSPNTNKGGIWQSGNGPASDGTNVYLATGDGTFDYNTGDGGLGDSILKLSPVLSVADYFTPKEQATLLLHDTDLGSAGPVVLPPLPGSSLNLLVHGAKSAALYLMDRDNMGHFDSQTDHVVQEFYATANGFFTSPVFWTGPSGSYLYAWGDSDAIRQYAWNPTTGMFNTTPMAMTGTAAFPGGGMSISANGSTNGIVWATTATTSARISNAPGVLHAYDATNVANELWNSSQNQARDNYGSYAKFNSPTVANGKVYVPSFPNSLAVYGLLGAPAPNFALSASPGSRTAPAGSGASYTVTMTPSGGFNGAVTYSVAGLPTGASGSFTPPSVSGSSVANSTLAVTTSTTTVAGTYTLTITGTSGTTTHSISITLIVNALPIGDFSLSATPASQTVTAGTNTNYTVTSTPSGGFNGTVTFSVVGLPTGAVASFTPPTASSSTVPVNSNMVVTTATTTAAGTYPLTIIGTSGTTHTTNVIFVVNPAVVGTPQTLLQIHGDATEVSGITSGSIVTPAIAPVGFTGKVVVNGTGSANFVQGQVGNGVYFLNCCVNTNNAYYRFTSPAVGNIFKMSQGQISFSLKSRYSFSQRLANATAPRYAFDVRDGNNAHLFGFYLQPSGTRLVFTYSAAGAAQYYFVPSGTEDALFGNGVALQVKLAWDGSLLNLYLNGNLVKSTSYTGATANWTPASNFDLGAYEYLTAGGYNVSDDVIDEFTVSGPGSTPPTLSITTPTSGTSQAGTIPLVASGTGLTGVQFQIDGNNFGSVVTGLGPTYSSSWDTATVANGPHTIGAVAIGAALNSSITVNVTNPVVPPVIIGVTATSITSTSATISWTTDQGANSQVAYGVSKAPYGATTTLNPAMVTQHSVNLSQLAPSTTYHYQALSQNVQGVLGTSLDFTLTTAASTGSQPLLLIHAEASEVSGKTNGSIVTPAIAPAGFAGTVTIRGSGSVNFTPAQTGNGVYFLSCCTNTNNAYYKFTGAGVGNVFNRAQGQISFSLKSRYSFAQRLANASLPRYAFDVRDGKGTHQILFYTRTNGTSLMFAYVVGGVGQYYFVPQGLEDTLFGNGVVLQVKLTWSGSTMNLYLNGTLVKASTYTPAAASWTSASNFDLGGYEYSTAGGYNVSEDVIDEFTVFPLP